MEQIHILSGTREEVIEDVNDFLEKFEYRKNTIKKIEHQIAPLIIVEGVHIKSYSVMIHYTETS
jgi:hypothetical protein